MNIDISKIQISKEEYLASTSIKDADEAARYLKRLKILFWSFFWSGIVMQVISEIDTTNSRYAIFYLIAMASYFALLVYFTYFCAKVLKKTNRKQYNAMFCFLFAPISWFYYYPYITEPLKIITGEIPLPPRMSEKTKKELKHNYAKGRKFMKYFWISTAIFVALFILALVYLEMQGIN